MVKSGIGYDVHPLKKGENLILGGVKISSSIGVVAYSDGDVLLHAMVDALLGAASLGDLGKYFPSSDKKWKDVSSSVFLEHAAKLLKNKKYKIINIDSTIILQKPKLSSYIFDIKKNISNILSLNENDISIKATTTDHLGYIGESKGWSVIAISTIYSTNEKNSY